jgi:MinD-like ATPase involved in chromosome partitioning or flagellar assembly
LPVQRIERCTEYTLVPKRGLLGGGKAFSTAELQAIADLLHDRRTARTLDRMQDALAPDVVLYDMPAILEYDDLGAFLPQVDGVLLVADATRTLARQITECERRLEGKTHLLGIILNRTRPAAQPRQRAA